MSILVVSVSHKSTSVSHLAELALESHGSVKLAEQLVDSEHIDEALVLSTCNRTELYASVSRFHGALDDATQALADVAGLRAGEVRSLCAVFFDEGAVAHTFSVAAGFSRGRRKPSSWTSQRRVSPWPSSPNSGPGPQLLVPAGDQGR
jgi:glutamyl-tRNA reductase